MLALNRSGSILFLMMIALDRYVRVVYPHHALNSLSVGKAVCGAAVLWLVTISMTAHLLALPRHNATDCESFFINSEGINFSGLWHKALFVVSFFVPMVVIMFCTCSMVAHLRRRPLGQQAQTKKALCFVSLVVALFVVCFIPSNVTQLLIWGRAGQIAFVHTGKAACDAVENQNMAFNITLSLTYLNSALDPVFYYLSIPTFKKMCRKAVRLERATDTGKDTPEWSRSRELTTHSISQL